MNLINNYKDNPKLLVDILSFSFKIKILSDVFYYKVNVPFIMPTGDVFQSVSLSNDINIGYVLMAGSNEEVYIMDGAYEAPHRRFNQDEFLKYIRNYKLYLLNKD